MSLSTLWETLSSLDSMERVAVMDDSQSREGLNDRDSSLIAKWLQSAPKMMFFYFR